MRLEYVVVKTGRVLDTVTLVDNAEIIYDTGAARGPVRNLLRRSAGRSILVGWTNGYVALRPASSAPSG